MARAPKAFGAGFVPSGLSILVGPVPVGQKWYVSKLDLYNTHSADVAVVLYVRMGGTPTQWKGFTLDADGGHCEVAADDKAIELEEGHAIMSTVSVASVVSYVSSGVVET